MNYDEYLETFLKGLNLKWYQLAYMKALSKVKCAEYFYMPRRTGKDWLFRQQIEMAKALKMNFRVATKDGIIEYKNGKKVKTK